MYIYCITDGLQRDADKGDARTHWSGKYSIIVINMSCLPSANCWDSS